MGGDCGRRQKSSEVKTIMNTFITQFLLRGRLLAVTGLAVASLALPAPLQGLDNARHTYLLQGEGEPAFIYGAPEEDADYELLTVRASDSVIGDAQLLLEEGQSVTVTHGGDSSTLEAKNETVDRLLRRLKMTPEEGEMVVLDMTGEELAISVTDHWYYDWEKTIPTTHDTEEIINPRLDSGVVQVAQAGQDGEYTESYTSLYADGVLSRTTYLGRTEDTAVTEIVERGTRVDSVDRSDRIAEVHPDEDGTGGYLVFTSGATMTYTSKMLCSATAYNIHGRTATGYPTEIGNIAVDPRVIPYGTRMYIQTVSGSWVYGMAVARDCGGAVKGNIIDLWFPDYSTCCQWGRRNCDVFILG